MLSNKEKEKENVSMKNLQYIENIQNNEKNIEGNEEINQNGEEILSNTRVDITFSQMNESNMSCESVKTYQSLPFKDDKLDLDLPNFNPTKFGNPYWKIVHSLSFFLFSAILATSTWFYFKKIGNIYYISLFIANFCFVISTILEWGHFRRGCIGYSNLNSKLKKNIDKSFSAKIIRSEYGIKYFISVMASFMFLFGNIYNVFLYGIAFDKTVGSIKVDTVFLDFNLFGMITLGFSQIMKLEKILTANKMNSIKKDFSKVLVEVLLFFGSLFYGASYMIQILYGAADESPLKTFYLIIRVIGNANFFFCSFVLQYRYYLSTDLFENDEFSDI